jgi:hypothetical protein
VLQSEDCRLLQEWPGAGSGQPEWHCSFCPAKSRQPDLGILKVSRDQDFN